MRNTPANAALKKLRKDKNISFRSVSYSLIYKGVSYECKFLNSFNVCYDCQISIAGVQVKQYTTYGTPSLKLSTELIEEYLLTN